jgi:hypothetical protein
MTRTVSKNVGSVSNFEILKPTKFEKIARKEGPNRIPNILAMMKMK